LTKKRLVKNENILELKIKQTKQQISKSNDNNNNKKKKKESSEKSIILTKS
jgi:hypothetical protein